MPRRITLIIDPQEERRSTLAVALAASGAETATAGDSADALARLDDETLAVVLLAGDAPGAASFVDTARARRPDLPVLRTTDDADALARQRDAALEAIHRLVSRSAHELNNPLGGVKLYIRLIEQRLSKAGDTYGEGLAQKVGHAVDRLTAMVADLAGHGRPAGTATQRVTVNTVLTEVLARVRDRLTAGEMQETVALGADVGAVDADPEGLGRVFFHLIANALDATAAGGHVTVTSRRTDPATIEVVIQDDGAGMDAATLSRATQLFFSTRQHGAGLGLATIRSLLASLGGRLDLESEPERGTRAIVRLPAIV